MLLTVAVAIGLSLGRCEDPELARVEATLTSIVMTVEDGDREALAEHVAVDYSDRLGQDSRAVVHRIMSAVEHIPDVRIELDHLQVEIEDKTGYATATFLPVFHGEADQELKRRPKYEFHKGRRLRVKFRRHGDRWLVVRGDMTLSLTGAL
jgi:hypothetical protein